jgi:hypothetical protein
VKSFAWSGLVRLSFKDPRRRKAKLPLKARGLFERMKLKRDPAVTSPVFWVSVPYRRVAPPGHARRVAQLPPTTTPPFPSSRVSPALIGYVGGRPWHSGFGVGSSTVVKTSSGAPAWLWALWGLWVVVAVALLVTTLIVIAK